MPTTPQVQRVPLSSSQAGERGFDWTAVGIVVLIGTLFAVAARFNAQPASSLVPAAVLSTSGCGLLVTALRKLRTVRRSGLLEASVGGLFLGLFQFVAAITYPGVLDILKGDPVQRQAFLTTWGLIVCFSIIFSMAGAVLGHLAFAPPRRLPAKRIPADEEDIEEIEEQQVDSADQEMEVPPVPRTTFSYFVTILLLGLAPTVIGYVFSAAYDYFFNLNQFLAGPLPTLRLLSALLPWQVPVHISLIPSDVGPFIFTQLWRIPFFFGNPTMFDFQALEPFVFNGAALGILLLTMYGRDIATREPPPQGAERAERTITLRMLLLFEALLGLVLVFPSNLWALQGLHGLLQFRGTPILVPGLQILNPLMFVLNLITGPLVCIGIGMLLYRVYRKRTRTEPINRRWAR